MRFITPHTDSWRPAGGEDGPQSRPRARPQLLLTLEQWRAVRETWPAGLATGLAVPNTVDITTLAADLPRLALVALQFPKWTDGRAYTQARLLRARLRYTGELRATGEVLVDMLPLLARTGFDAVALRHDQSLEAATRALSYFAGHYQGDVAEPRPAFARDLSQELADPASGNGHLFAGQGI
jgi:uncharacterized protein (DUF934 family)